MDLSVFISIAVAALVVAGAYWYFSSTASMPSYTTIQSTTEDGRHSFRSNKALPRSLDQKEGLTFSYTCWVMIDNFEYRYGEPKVIFTKGSEDLKTMCPALLVDANTNSLLVKIDTFGGTETIPISNIPAKKWLHVAIAVDQDSVDVYINGNIYIHHSITQVPKQNNSTVSTGVAVDKISWNRVKQAKAKVHITSLKENGLLLVDIKDGEGMTSFNKFKGLEQITNRSGIPNN